MDKISLGQKLAGDNSEKGRRKGDFYPTPPWAVEALLKVEQFEGSTWEPACGTGNVSKVLINHGMRVHSSDIVDYGYGISDRDFLIHGSLFGDHHEMHDNIITNPPFGVALEFVEMSKRWASKKVALLLKTTFLEGKERYYMWKDKRFPFKAMYQFSGRVNFGKEEGEYEGTGMIAFAWYVWEREYSGKPTIDWII